MEGKIRKYSWSSHTSVVERNMKKDLLSYSMKTVWCQPSKIFSEIGIVLQDNRFILGNVKMLISKKKWVTGIWGLC